MATEITTTAVQIATLNFLDIVIKNMGPAVVYLGGDSGVTGDQSSAGGYPLSPGEVVTLPNRGAGTINLYAVTAEGTAYIVAFAE